MAVAINENFFNNTQLNSGNWKTNEDQALTQENFEALLSNEIPLIRIKNFANSIECESLLNAIEVIGYDSYENTVPPIGRIGTTQYEFRDRGANGMKDYFKMAEKANRQRDLMSALSFSPLRRLQTQIAEVSGRPIAVAKESRYENSTYFAGVVRQINNSALIHADYAGFDAPDWSIGRIQNQLSWNLFVRASDLGGECIVYNRPWLLKDEQKRIPGSYSYDRSIIENVDFKVIIPVTGDLVIFNSRNFHEVKKAEGNRVTMSSFIGELSNSCLTMWS